MTTYFYQATDTTGTVIEGDVEAPDQQVAVQKVRNLNYFPIKVSPEKPDTSFPQEMESPNIGRFFFLKSFFL